jgi:predicted DCC family thiol-disulfide oxidoreductase YuxK
VGLVDPETPVVLFDGQCNLCTGAVQFILRRDPAARFRFASRDSEVGRALLARVGLPEQPESIVLVHRGAAWTGTGAVLAIARRLPLPWPLASMFCIVPAPLRDLGYRWIAKNRYRWFGKREQCWVPTPELRSRFLDADEPRAGMR